VSDFTKLIMSRINSRFANSGINLQEFGERMGYGHATARKSAWQFLNTTADPRLSMIEKAAKALGISVAELFKAPPQRQTLHEALRGSAAETIAAVYSAVSEGVSSGRLSRDQAIRELSSGTESAISNQPEEIRKQWDKWRVKTGQRLHAGQQTHSAYAALLLDVAAELRASSQPPR
jgi:transcriptional regulator with XRE-family HTH domain